MKPLTVTKLKINLRNSWRMASNWCTVGASFGYGVFLSLTGDQQQAIVSHLWVPPWLVPAAVATLTVAARVWPQHSISGAVAAAKSEDAPQP